MKHKATTPKAPLPLPDDKPLIPMTEQERMKKTERNYFLSTEERQAILDKWPIISPRKPPNGAFVPKPKGGKGA